MKEIILTLDYELFFGTKSGTVEKCMIEPIDLLIVLFEKYNCKMTIFWDVLHYIKAKELGVKHEVKKLKRSIEKLVQNGHDVQLHIHSHWVDAIYKDKKWIFPTYEHYNLQSFSKEKILDIVTNAKKTIEDITKQEVVAFRAGGWQIEPFEKIKDALAENEIFYDSSVAFGKKQKSSIVNLNFKNYPQDSVYKFEDTPKVKKSGGSFVEYQIKSIKVPNYIISYSYIKKLITRESYPPLGDGVGIGNTNTNLFDRYKVLLERACLGSRDMLSLEFTSEFIFKYMLKKSKNYSVMIGHPKSIGYKHIKVLEEVLKSNEIKFISMAKVIA